MKHELIHDAVMGIMESADEILEKANKTDFDNGQLTAYAEALCILQDAFRGYDLAKIGLDFDVDEKYLK